MKILAEERVGVMMGKEKSFSALCTAIQFFMASLKPQTSTMTGLKSSW